MSQLILYASEDGRSQVQLRAEHGTVWLTQLDMAELFNASKQNISLHLKNIFEGGELDPAATVKESLTVQTEGKHEILYTLCRKLCWRPNRLTSDQLRGVAKLIGLNKFAVPIVRNKL